MIGNNETASEIEVRIAHWFGEVTNVIVPNVSWGMFGDRELDLAILNKSGYLYEVEIKISKSDLKKDKEKWHNHKHKWIKRLYFAVPEKLKQDIKLIPDNASIFIVNKQGQVQLIREAKDDNEAQKLPLEKQFQLARLGAMRIWKLKNNNLIKR